MRKNVNSIVDHRNNKQNTILLTGGTSFLGSRVASTLLQKGCKIIFLIRETEKLDAYQRLYQILHAIDHKDFSNIKVLNSKIDEPKLGLNDENYNYLLNNVDEIFHSAADTSFKIEHQERVKATNENSTLHLLELAEKSKCYFFHYMSTAYIHGKKSGICNEDYFFQNDFHNSYEQSKYNSEGYVIEKCKKNGIRANIYRPSIVYGDTKTGKSIRFNAMYYFVRTFHYIKTIYERDMDKNNGLLSKDIGIKRSENGEIYLPIRIKCLKDGAFNLIPVDYLVDAITALYDNCLDGDIYHITADKEIKMDEALNLIKKYFKIDGLRTVTPEELDKQPLNPLEDLFYSYMEIYMPYLQDIRKFDKSNTEKILRQNNISYTHIDYNILKKCVDYAIEVGWGMKIFNEIEAPSTPNPDWIIDDSSMQKLAIV